MCVCENYSEVIEAIITAPHTINPIVCGTEGLKVPLYMQTLQTQVIFCLSHTMHARWSTQVHRQAATVKWTYVCKIMLRAY